MNAPRLLARRTTNTVCLSCRRNLAADAVARRQFSSSPSRFAAASFQSYTLPSQPPAAPRNVSAPDTSVTRPIQSPPTLPTRPPKQPQFSVPEQEAQQSKSSFVAANTNTNTTSATTTSASSSQQPPASASASAAATSSATPKPTTAAPKPRASKLRTPRKAAMKLTPSAVERLREMLDQPDPKLVKVGVRNRGCSGLAYHLEYVDKAGAFDESVEQDGVRVLIDSKALFSIIGSEMDWVEDKLSQRFVFRNPNIKEQCGCGESFMV